MEKRLGGWIAALAVAIGGMPTAGAEVVDITRTVGASGSVGAAATLTVTARNVSDNAVTTGISFGAVPPAGSLWTRAPQYLRLQYSSNQASWAIRVLTNNRATFGGMAGRVTNDGGTPSDPADDQLSYSGMIGTTPTDPNNRAPWAWQVYKETVVGGPAAPTDAQVSGAFNAPWAFIADASDCLSACRTATPVTVDKTSEYFQVVFGNPSQSGLRLHPDDGNRAGDGDVSAYVAARFGGVPADTYASTVIVEMYHF